MPIKFKMDECKKCDGQGVLFYTEKKLFGLVKNQVAFQCPECGGEGKIRGEPYCPVCNGEGLIGNERELCRTCNGTGGGDAFRHVPREQLTTGTSFNRRCDRCNAITLHEFISEIESKVVTTTWEKNEWDRSKEEFERIKIECTMCGRNYYAMLDRFFHSEKGFHPDLVRADEDGKEKRLFGQDFSSPGEIFGRK